MRRQVTPNVAAGRAFAHEACVSRHIVEPTNVSPRVVAIGPNFQDIANTKGMTATALRVFDHLAPEDAEPDPHARSDHRRDRLHPELTRATADQGAPFLSAAPIGVSGLFRAIRHRG